ncbi:hypothetical protein M0R45_035781 [Rubus argutus]|uniref:Uncharacterized protein n=1 Tax=Rubus argutus TaxID=59490 RepID=A0AAW1VXY1_RUBAR
MTTDAEKGKEIVVGSTSTTAGEDREASQATSDKRTKNKRRREKAAPRKPATRSWVWDHFDKIEKPIMETIDGVEKKVGHETRAKWKQASVAH